MKVAAYQAPYLPFGSTEAIGLIAWPLEICRSEAVDVLCCPEAVIGGLALESAHQARPPTSPSRWRAVSWPKPWPRSCRPR